MPVPLYAYSVEVSALVPLVSRMLPWLEEGSASRRMLPRVSPVPLETALEMALAALHEAENSRLVLPQKNGQLVLEKREITRLERRLRVTNIYTADGECVSTAAPLDDLLTQLDSPSFLRCHNSFAVNLSHVAAFRRESFLMKDGTVVPISHTYCAAVREEFQKYHSGDL